MIWNILEDVGIFGHLVLCFLKVNFQLQVHVVNRLGDTPLHLAALKGSQVCIQLLLEREPKLLTEINNEAKTAYDLANDPEAKSLLEIRSQNQEDYEQSDED